MLLIKLPVQYLTEGFTLKKFILLLAVALHCDLSIIFQLKR